MGVSRVSSCIVHQALCARSVARPAIASRDATNLALLHEADAEPFAQRYKHLFPRVQDAGQGQSIHRLSLWAVIYNQAGISIGSRDG